MKKLFAAIFSCTLLFLAACGNLNTSQTEGEILENHLPSVSSQSTAQITTTPLSTNATTSIITTTTTRNQTSTTVPPTIAEPTTQQKISRTVYITPTGKRYHYRSTCGGKNSFAVELDQAIAQGYTPCKKCVG